MTRKIAAGISDELDAAFNQSIQLKAGEYMLVPTDNKEHAQKLQRYFFRLRRRVTAMVEGQTGMASNRNDPWQGLITYVRQLDGTGPWALEIRRPRCIETVTIIHSDGSSSRVNVSQADD